MKKVFKKVLAVIVAVSMVASFASTFTLTSSAAVTGTHRASTEAEYNALQGAVLQSGTARLLSALGNPNDLVLTNSGNGYSLVSNNPNLRGTIVLIGLHGNTYTRFEVNINGTGTYNFNGQNLSRVKYGAYQALNYRVTYMDNGRVLGSFFYEEDETITVLDPSAFNLVASSGYKFKGWDKFYDNYSGPTPGSPHFGGYEFAGSPFFRLYGNVTLVAIWECDNDCPGGCGSCLNCEPCDCYVCECDLDCKNVCTSNDGCTPVCGEPCDCVCVCDLDCGNNCPSNPGCTPECGDLCDCACLCDLECNSDCPNSTCEPTCGNECECDCSCDLDCNSDCPNSTCEPSCGNECECDCSCDLDCNSDCPNST
ncbi:MAG: hypothetical protein FWD34_09240, partial [Oscillospiraceae bacterium]|nr:hypothetical protein [Oscillospiraceae bacterium]